MSQMMNGAAEFFAFACMNEVDVGIKTLLLAVKVIPNSS